MIDGSRKRPSRAVSGLLLVAVSVAAAPRGRTAPASPELAATRPEDRVIFDAKATRKWMSIGASGDVWTPTLAEVLALEEKLPGYLREHRDAHENPRKPPLWKRAPGYKRQYFGITRRGERAIYANFFCGRSENAPDWHQVPVSVEDGGDCYFSIKYEIKRRTFEELVVNGEA